MATSIDSPGFSRHERRRWTTWLADKMSSVETPSSAIAPRDTSLSKGGIAGVTVGCIVAVVLLAFCAYPFIIRRLRKVKHHGTATGLDPETAMAPGAAAAGHLAGTDGSRRLSSRDSFAQKPEPFRGPERQSTKEMTLGSLDGVGYGGLKRQERSFPPDLNGDHPLDGLARRQSGFSLGHVQTFHSDAQEPYVPDEIPLSATRADGLEYSENMGGHSASYYSPTIPSEAFGMVSPPPTDEPPAQALARRRTSSRASSLKFNFMSIMRRMSTKESGSPSSPLSDSPMGPPPARTMTVTMGPPAAPQQMAAQNLSESPTTLTGPSFHSTPPGLASPVRLAQPGSPDREMGAKEASPSYIPPPIPTPGTVNPMDIMAPANETEHNWHTNHQLYHFDTLQSLPAHHPVPPSQIPQDNSQTTTPKPDHHHHHQQQPAPLPYVVDPTSQPPQPEPHYNPPAPTSASHEVEMTDVAAPYDHTHLMPVQNGSSDVDYSERSDRSTPMPSHSSSGPSTQATPDTRITDSSPSPRSDGSSDLRSSASPYPGLNASPRAFVCDECHREFDQVHKLNHHKRYHERPHECAHPGCGKKFGTKTHLDRHINDKHKKTRKYHCTEQSCAYSKAGGKSFPRKDNWRRHMMNIHAVNPQHDPEPDIIDENMIGT